MKRSTAVSAIAAALLLFACQEVAEPNVHDAISFSVPSIHATNLRIDKIRFDKMALDSFSSSLDGKLYISGSRLIFVDDHLCFLSEFDTSGRFVSRHLGRGKGPDELPVKKIGFFGRTSDGNYFFIGTSWDCYLFDKNFHHLDDYEINWHPSNRTGGAENRPDPSTTDLYTLAYGFGAMDIDGTTAYLPLLSQARSFNSISPTYSSDARMLATMDIRNGYIGKIMGRLSPVYRENKNFQTQTYLNFQLAPANQLYLSYPLDSFIYVSDRKFTIERKFGRKGRDMNMSYTAVDNISNFWNVWNRQETRLGHYGAIKYIKDMNLLFRSYQKGIPSSSDGLQIYRNDTIVADIDVPKGFEVIGYIYPYFYSNAFSDEDKERVGFYKFRIDLKP